MNTDKIKYEMQESQVNDAKRALSKLKNSCLVSRILEDNNPKFVDEENISVTYSNFSHLPDEHSKRLVISSGNKIAGLMPPPCTAYDIFYDSKSEALMFTFEGDHYALIV